MPDLVQKDLKEIQAFQYHRAGFSRTGTPNQISVRRTIRNSFGRRLALGRPKAAEVEEVEAEVEDIETTGPKSEADLYRLSTLKTKLIELEESRRNVPYLDPIDIRYKRLDKFPRPNTKAVMFCLMDVSGSMGEREKDLAKRFFILLHLFLKRRYEQTDIVFIRHTHEASEVDEETRSSTARNPAAPWSATALHRNEPDYSGALSRSREAGTSMRRPGIGR